MIFPLSTSWKLLIIFLVFGPGMCEAVSIIHSLALGGHKHSKHKHKPTNKKANQSQPDLRAELMRPSHGNSTAMGPSYLDTKVKFSC